MAEQRRQMFEGYGNTQLSPVAVASVDPLVKAKQAEADAIKTQANSNVQMMGTALDIYGEGVKHLHGEKVKGVMEELAASEKAKVARADALVALGMADVVHTKGLAFSSVPQDSVFAPNSVVGEIANAKLAELSEEKQRVTNAVEAGGISAASANARIAALDKEYSAMYPGIANQIRQMSVDIVGSELYGNKGVYQLLMGQQKAAEEQKYNAEALSFAIQNGYADLKGKFYSAKHEELARVAYVDYSQRQYLKKDTEAKVETAAAQGKLTEVIAGPALTQKLTAHKMDKLNPYLLQQGNRLAALTPTEQGSNAGTLIVKETQDGLRQAMQEQLNEVDMMASKGKFQPEWVKARKAEITAEFDAMQKQYSTPTALTAYTELQKISALSWEQKQLLAKNTNVLATALGEQALLPGGQWMTFVSLVNAAGLPMYDRAAMNPEQKKQFETYQRQFGFDDKTLNLVEQLTSIRDAKAGDTTLVTWENAIRTPQGEYVPYEQMRKAADTGNLQAQLVLRNAAQSFPKDPAKASDVDTLGVKIRASDTDGEFSYTLGATQVLDPSKPEEWPARVSGMTQNMRKDIETATKSGKFSPAEIDMLKQKHAQALLAMLQGGTGAYTVEGLMRSVPTDTKARISNAGISYKVEANGETDNATIRKLQAVTNTLNVIRPALSNAGFPDAVVDPYNLQAIEGVTMKGVAAPTTTSDGGSKSLGKTPVAQQVGQSFDLWVSDKPGIRSGIAAALKGGATAETLSAMLRLTPEQVAAIIDMTKKEYNL